LFIYLLAYLFIWMAEVRVCVSYTNWYIQVWCSPDIQLAVSARRKWNFVNDHFSGPGRAVGQCVSVCLCLWTNYLWPGSSWLRLAQGQRSRSMMEKNVAEVVGATSSDDFLVLKFYRTEQVGRRVKAEVDILQVTCSERRVMDLPQFDGRPWSLRAYWTWLREWQTGPGGCSLDTPTSQHCGVSGMQH